MAEMRHIGTQLMDMETVSACTHIPFLASLTKDQSKKMKIEKDDNILEWLSPLNFCEKQDDLYERRQSGTGEWLLILEALRISEMA
jgi:hypothetical protein